MRASVNGLFSFYGVGLEGQIGIDSLNTGLSMTGSAGPAFTRAELKGGLFSGNLTQVGVGIWGAGAVAINVWVGNGSTNYHLYVTELGLGILGARATSLGVGLGGGTYGIYGEFL